MGTEVKATDDSRMGKIEEKNFYQRGGGSLWGAMEGGWRANLEAGKKSTTSTTRGGRNFSRAKHTRESFWRIRNSRR